MQGLGTNYKSGKGPHDSASLSLKYTSSLMEVKGPTTDSDVTRYSFSGWQKCLLLAGCSFTIFTSASALSSIFPATAHVALELSTTPKVLNIANACVQVAMGLSVFVWQPVQVFIGRRNSFLLALLILLCFSIGAARATSTGMFIAMRVIVGSTGTFFLLAGQEILAETFEPVSGIVWGSRHSRVSACLAARGNFDFSEGMVDFCSDL